MGFYDIDFRVLIRTIVPVRLRNNIMLAWLAVLVSPVVWLYDMFKVNRDNDLYDLSHNSQVCYLRAALNDLFDPVSRGILIEDGPFRDPLYLYLVPESKPLWLGLFSEAGSTPYPDPEVLYLDAETALLGISFIVKVPVAIAAGAGYDVQRLKALVDHFRLPGRRNYSVVTY